MNEGVFAPWCTVTLAVRNLVPVRLFSPVFRAAAATRCGLSFFGVDQVLFASDTPFEPEPGTYIRETIDVLDRFELTGQERARIYPGNAERLLRLSASA